MSWSNPPRGGSGVKARAFRLLAFLLMFLGQAAFAAESGVDSDIDVWLVTYGPGNASWERFGHNAIWLRSASDGLDHLFNFGFFDFEQEAFYRRFLTGKLLYFSAAQPAEREFSYYVGVDRSIRAQRLDLGQHQALELADYLLNEVREENRDYLYDYYTNNCSTRVRDALDLATGGALRATFTRQAAEQNFRDHTRRLSEPDYWLYLGLELSLGSRIDAPISRWDEFFIPSELADALEEFRLPAAQGGGPLVVEEVMLYRSDREQPPAVTAAWWLRYLALGLLAVAAGWLAVRWIPGVAPGPLVKTWLVVSGLAGCALVFFWFFTDHLAAGRNANLLLLNPLFLVLAAGSNKPLTAWAVTGSTLVALLMALVPGGQYLSDTVAVFAPLNLACATALLKNRR